MTLLSRTKEITKRRGLTIEKLANEVGISKSGIYQWDNHEPKPSTIDKVANVLNVSTDYLLGRTQNSGPVDQNKTADILDNETILAFDGKPIDEEDRQKLLEYARFILAERNKEDK